MKPGDPAAVEQLFDAVAPRYDQLNDLLSLGLHRQWKRQLVRWLNPVAGETWLDLCCGTGDLAMELARCVRPGGAVIGLDAAAEPLAIARRRQQLQPWLPLSFSQGDALDTGLPAASADGIVMAYGLRNLADPAAGLREIARLLSPGAAGSGERLESGAAPQPDGGSDGRAGAGTVKLGLRRLRRGLVAS